MPIIDVSQSSYRALVIAAHRRGMSVDKFIQQNLVENAAGSGVDDAGTGESGNPSQKSGQSSVIYFENPAPGAVTERVVAKIGPGAELPLETLEPSERA